MSSSRPVSPQIADATTAGPTFLMCSPELYEVSYVINPWMEGNVHALRSREARTQWDKLALGDVAIRPHRVGRPAARLT